MAEIAAAFVTIAPSLKGFASKLTADASGETKSAGGVLGGLLGKTMLAGFAAVGVATAVGKELYDIGSTFDDISDSIRISTGKSGAALDGLTQSAENVGKKAPVALESIAPVLGTVNKRLGLTGKPLEKVTTQFVDLGHLLDQDIDVDTVTKSFAAFGVKGAQTSKALDQIFRVTQSTGISFDSLTGSLSRNGPVLSQFGFSLNQSASLIGSLDKAGLDSNKTLASLSKAMATFAKDGQDPQKALLGTIDQIHGFIKAGDQAGAVNLASKVFGTRGATQFVAAVKSGTLNVKSLTDATKGNSDTITKATADTSDFAEAFQLFKNRALLAVEPIATRVFNALGQGLQSLAKGGALKVAIQSLKGLGTTFLGVFNPIADNVLPRVSTALRQLLPSVLRLSKTVGGALLRSFADLVVVFAPLLTSAGKLGAVVLPALLPVLTRVGAVLTAVTGFMKNNATAVRALAVAVIAGVTIYKAYQLAVAASTAIQTGYAAASYGAAGATYATGAASKIYSLLMARQTVVTIAQTVAQKAAAAASKAWAVAQGALNIVMSANPIALVVLAIAGLVAAFVIAYKKSDTFRAIVQSTFNGIKKVVSSVINFVVPFVKKHWQLLVAIIGGPMAAIAILVVKHFGTIKSIASSVANFVVGTAKKYGEFASEVADKVGKVVTFFKQLPGKIKGFLTSLPGQLKTIGGQIVDGLKRGIEGAAGKVLSAVQSIVNKIPKFIRKHLGIASPSKVTTYFGQMVSEGLAVGMTQKTAVVTKAATALGQTIDEKVGDGIDKAKEKAKKKTAELVKSIQSKLSGLKDDFASLTDPISSNFTQNLFDFTDASAFDANLKTVKGNLNGLLGNFQKLIGEGLAPGFLYQLFQSGGVPLINSLAALDRSSALGIAQDYAQVTNLSDTLGNRVALATDKGSQIDHQTDVLSAKLDKLTKAVKHSGDQAERAGTKAATNAQHRKHRKKVTV